MEITLLIQSQRGALCAPLPLTYCMYTILFDLLVSVWCISQYNFYEKGMGGNPAIHLLSLVQHGFTLKDRTISASCVTSSLSQALYAF